MTVPAERLIISLHIPKTGGTSFAAVLEHAYPGQVAYFYKPHNRRTHPLLRDPNRKLDAGVAARLEGEGVRILHGHGGYATYAQAQPDPARYWTWVRDPVERVISSYFYHLARQAHAAIAGKGPDKAGGLTLEDFASVPANRNQQSRILGGAALETFGFVGITERFDESLALLGLSSAALRKAKNVNRERPEIAQAARAVIGQVNDQDMLLYQRATELHEARVRPFSTSQ